MPYPEITHLPFTRAALGETFVPGPPDAERRGEPGFWLLLRGNDLLTIRLADGRPDLPFGPAPVPAVWEVPPVCIGTLAGKPLRAARLPAEAVIPEGMLPMPAGIRRTDLDDRLLSLAGMARQILHWRERSRICPACGGRPLGIPATYGVRCPACGREYFPHVHPAIIVLVRRGDEFLLVRKPYWPQGQYGLVAGYVEFGETLEECVLREVLEETSIRVEDPRYLVSQAWPYPSQIMTGFTAEYVGGTIAVDTTELEHADWFRADRLPPSLSPRGSTARYIIDTYALGK